MIPDGKAVVFGAVHLIITPARLTPASQGQLLSPPRTTITWPAPRRDGRGLDWSRVSGVASGPILSLVSPSPASCAVALLLLPPTNTTTTIWNGPTPTPTTALVGGKVNNPMLIIRTAKRTRPAVETFIHCSSRLQIRLGQTYVAVWVQVLCNCTGTNQPSRGNFGGFFCLRMLRVYANRKHRFELGSECERLLSCSLAALNGSFLVSLYAGFGCALRFLLLAQLKLLGQSRAMLTHVQCYFFLFSRPKRFADYVSTFSQFYLVLCLTNSSSPSIVFSEQIEGTVTFNKTL